MAKDDEWSNVCSLRYACKQQMLSGHHHHRYHGEINPEPCTCPVIDIQGTKRSVRA